MSPRLCRNVGRSRAWRLAGLAVAVVVGGGVDGDGDADGAGCPASGAATIHSMASAGIATSSPDGFLKISKRQDGMCTSLDSERRGPRA